MIDLLRQYLSAMGRHGVSPVVARLRRLAINLNGSFGCEECGAGWPEMYPFMVDDHLWCEVVGDDEAHLCIECFERKMFSVIGRKLVPGDLTNVPVNQSLLKGIHMSRKGRSR